MKKEFDFEKITERFSGSYIQIIYDHIQTHCAYGISKSDVNEAKDILKQIGAKQFRVVNTKFGVACICFQVK
jgi:hypothetical protein